MSRMTCIEDWIWDQAAMPLPLQQRTTWAFEKPYRKNTADNPGRYCLAGLAQSFELMEQYADHPMDLVDASLLLAAESLNAHKIFTLDLNDFETYPIRRGHRRIKFEVIS